LRRNRQIVNLRENFHTIHSWWRQKCNSPCRSFAWCLSQLETQSVDSLHQSFQHPRVRGRHWIPTFKSSQMTQVPWKQICEIHFRWNWNHDRLYTRQHLEGEGVLHLTTKRLVWLGGPGCAIDYPFITMSLVQKEKSNRLVWVGLSHLEVQWRCAVLCPGNVEWKQVCCD
jgi:hypothetical protein